MDKLQRKLDYLYYHTKTNVIYVDIMLRPLHRNLNGRNRVNCNLVLKIIY